jgi:tetratricopeptide (TPR) repeat protein
MATSIRKKRVPIPRGIAAKVMFNSDRTCCVCRISGRKIQIHHIDDNPSNNVMPNLAVLCLECHGETQVTGGFGRRLDAEQVILYRDDWHSIVAGQRLQFYRDTRDQIPKGESRITYYTSVIERLRDSGDYITLASVYNDLGNIELRDKYVDKAFDGDSSDWMIIYLRALQGRKDLIPEEVAARRLEQQAQSRDWSQRARTLVKMERYTEAARDYVRGVLRNLEAGNTFAAAYYLKELHKKGIVERLFEHALQEAADGDDLWWQVRALQELGWHSELKELVLANEELIDSTGDPLLLRELYSAKGEREKAEMIAVEIVASKRRSGERISIPGLTDDIRRSPDKT